MSEFRHFTPRIPVDRRALEVRARKEARALGHRLNRWRQWEYAKRKTECQLCGCQAIINPLGTIGLATYGPAVEMPCPNDRLLNGHVRLIEESGGE